ncbi:aminotransferase class I/II-fold pyridoxal phosphate-dependent enzyme [Pelotomaculum propionicicum]|uniref:aminotransferase class I/II-fold pyridoxal phosphate-dependent enzyme n=1 Tax=Pelotomaculum propionicicum TaxID=258475 RepID=UPI003B7F130D
MLDNQRRAPLFEALKKHAGKNPACFHIPGHGQGKGLPFELSSQGGQALFGLDLTELPGLDDLHNPAGPIAEAQGLAAKIYGSDRCFFLVNGTTAGIHALVTALVRQEKVIISRNAHRSVLGGVILSGADPVYVWPEVIPEFTVDCGVAPAVIKQVLADNPGAAAVLAVRPNYYGVAGDLDIVTRAAHEAGIPVLVDEAHGAHLRFHRDLPRDAMDAGADASVQSTHKLGGSLGQSSMLHLREGLVDAGAVAASLRLLQTTSPSYLLMASLDLARRMMSLQGGDIMEKALDLARGLRDRLAAIENLRVLTGDCLPENCALDSTKLVISVRGLGLTGYQVNGLLAGRYNVFVEMADFCNIVAFISTGTTAEDCDRLVGALRDIAARDKRPALPPPPAAPSICRKVMKPRDAWFARSIKVPLAGARGKICAEAVAVYPPGIPVVNPGEEITAEIYEYLRMVSEAGLSCQGPSDPTLNTIKIVIE